MYVHLTINGHAHVHVMHMYVHMHLAGCACACAEQGREPQSVSRSRLFVRRRNSGLFNCSGVLSCVGSSCSPGFCLWVACDVCARACVCSYGKVRCAVSARVQGLHIHMYRDVCATLFTRL